ncbi:MAG: GDP-mannose 4,6-dehydratase [Candidatus Marsarchaeota archaeon]|nr:GDP-mannose 4,6-dehydratase [Candidatus Marsarchaeota archaeon]
MKVMILGIDGYLGWPLALRMASKGYEVIGIDNMATRKSVEEVGSISALPIKSMDERVKIANKEFKGKITFVKGDITDYKLIYDTIKEHTPETIVHFAEQRSAPYSMIDVNHATYTMRNNINGTINLIYAIRDADLDTHVVKMGTMGEFGTPKFDIPEAPFVDVEIKGKRDKITTPKWGGSWYHWTKVHDTNNLLFANKLWGITMTDIMQGPVYGTRTSEIKSEDLFTRFDFDAVWGTVVNRYCVEAILGEPLTPYGKGGQIRGFLSLQDSMDALTLLVENKPKTGEYRSVNQFMELLSVNEIAEIVKTEAAKLGIDAKIKNVENPRVEEEQHHYNPERTVLPSLGFKLKVLKVQMKDAIGEIIKDLLPNKNRLENYKDVLLPKTRWR